MDSNTKKDLTKYNWYLSVKNLEKWAFANNLFSKEECQKIIDQSLKLEKLNATLKDGVVNQSIRKNSISWLPSNDPEFEWAFRKLTDAVNSINDQFWQFDLDYIEILQFTHYDQLGDFYDFHSDILHTGPHYRKMSFSLQLSDPSAYKGSELEFYHSGNTFDKSKTDQGTLIVFPSFIPHRVTPLTEGKRYSLVGWVCGKAFK